MGAGRRSLRECLILLGAVAIPACAGEPRAPEASPLPPLEERAAEVLSQAIRIRTVNPPGDELPLALYFAQLLRAGGLEARVLDTPAGASERGRGATWARLAGAGGRPAIVLLSHLDVVPARPAEWRRDPFAGAIEAGQVVGRGALDAKGVTVVHLFALLELVRRGIRLERDVIFLATPDEESGGSDGAGFLTRERPELLAGAAYLLTEGGSVTRAAAGRPAEWGVSVSEKSPCWLQLLARGASGHSSVPPDDAAVHRLVAALERVRLLRPPLRVTPEVARMFSALAPLAAARDAAGYASLAPALEADPAFRQRFLASPARRALVHDTLSITVLGGSARTNVLASEALAHVDVRLLPGGRCEDFARRLQDAIGDPGVSVQVLLAFPSKSSEPRGPLYRSIARVAAVEDPGAVVVPRVTAGFTDAHYFRELGITAYGFTPRWHYEGEPRGVHGADEAISAENLARGVETLIAILQALDREEGAGD